MSSRSSVWLPSPFQTQAYSVSAGGDNIIVSGAAGKSVRVYRMKMKVNAAVSITIKDTAGNILDGPLPFTAGNEGWILDFFSPDNPPWYITALGSGFVINLSAPATVGGNVEFVLS